MALKMTTKLPKGADRFLWTAIPIPPKPNYGHILKFDPSQPRDPKGTHTGGRFARSPLEQKRRDIMALIKRDDLAEKHLSTMRTGLNDAWKTWLADVNNRKKPLKPDGAAAKKLDTYKKAQALEKAFQERHDVVNAKKRAMNQQVKELLKVPKDQRSPVAFEADTTAPLHPALVGSAKRALEVFRQFDGSGAFNPVTFSGEEGRKIQELGSVPVIQNPDGTYSMPRKSLKVSKSAINRAHATVYGIALGDGRDLDKAVFHEVAHHIEFNSGTVLREAIKLRESLANQPRDVYKLNTLRPGLGDDEIALRGKFPDPYAGKIYPHDISTEIVSTGVELYMSDPVRFARERPEHFNFIFDVMQGKYRGAA